MLRLISALLALVIIITAAVAGLVLMARDPAPVLPAMPAISAEERRWGQELLHERVLRGMQTGGIQALELSDADLDTVAVLLAERFDDSRLHIDVGDSQAQVAASAPLPPSLGGWLNLEAELRQTRDQGLVIERVSVGSLPIPPALARLLMQQGLDAFDAPDLLSAVELTPDGVVIGPAATGAGAQGLQTGGPGEGARVLAALRRLAHLVRERAQQREIDAAELLGALIAAAPAGADAVATNRAAILALSAYVNGGSLPDSDAGSASPPQVPLQLHGQDDLAQHFLTSAALSLQGGARLADLIGVAKELGDADGGSGFSFGDLAANRAGQRFAELAAGEAESARRIRAMAVAGLSASDIAPAVDWLPAAMTRTALQRDFGGRDGDAYQIVVGAIDRRIAKLPMMRAE